MKKINPKQKMTTEELNKIVDQLRGYDKHLRKCMGWTLRAAELEVLSGMQEAQKEDLKNAEDFLANTTKP